MSSTVIRKLKAHFARYGLPSVVVMVMDLSLLVKSSKILQLNMTEHKASSPKYPKSNGMAESAVKMAKRLIRKAKESGKDPHMAILDYRNTPTQGSEFSPVQCNLGRRTRTLLPTMSSLLHPKQVDNFLVKKEKKMRNSRSKWYYDKSAKDLVELEEGDFVRIKPTVLGEKKWRFGKVAEKLDKRSYLVEPDSGVLRRNRVHLRKSFENESQSFDNVQTNVNSDDVHQNPVQVNVNCNANHLEASGVLNTSDNPILSNRSTRSTRNKLSDRYKDYVVSK